MSKRMFSMVTAVIVTSGFAVATAPVALAAGESITLGSISSNPVAGTASTKTIAVTTANLNGVPLKTTWITSPSDTSTVTPTGISKSSGTPTNDATTITLTFANTVVAGTYYLEVKDFQNPNRATPVIATITVDAAQQSNNSSSSSSASDAAAAAAKAAAEQVAKAKATLVDSLKAGKPITANDLNSADISVASSAAADRVNAKIQALPAAQRSDLATIKVLVQKENFVEKVSSSATQAQVNITDLVRVGLLPADYKNKSEVVRTLVGIDPASLTSIEKVEAAVKKAQAEIQARKDRLTATITRIQTRK